MKKIAFLLAALMLLTAGLAGCGGNDSQSSQPAQDQQQADTQEPADTPADAAGDAASTGGTLVMGTEATFPPYEFVDADGGIAGIDAEVAQAIADKLGMSLEIKDMAFDSLISAVQGGSIDFAMAGMTVNPERAESVDFSTSYATGVQVVIVPEGSDITFDRRP